MEALTDAGAVFETDHLGCTTMPHHRHMVPFVTIVLNGSYVEVRDAVPDVCCSGAIVVHDAGQEHADRFARDTRCLNVELPHGAVPVRPGVIVLDRPPLSDAVRGVVGSFYAHNEGELLHAVRRLQLLVADRPSALDAPRWLLELTQGFPWVQAVPLRRAAAIAGMHETHFSRAFRRHAGMTAREYRARARIGHASKLLLTTGQPVANVALNSGFSDQSHLTRAFTQRLGLAPALYRRTFAR